MAHKLVYFGEHLTPVVIAPKRSRRDRAAARVTTPAALCNPPWMPDGGVVALPCETQSATGMKKALRTASNGMPWIVGMAMSTPRRLPRPD